MKKIIFMTPVLAMFIASSVFADSVYKFKETGIGTASKYDRRIDAEKRAVEDALSNALSAGRVEIFSGLQDVMTSGGKRETESISQYIYSFTRGVPVYKKTSHSCVSTSDEGIKCTVTIEGEISYHGDADPDFKIIFPENCGLNKPVYYDGDKVEVSFKSTKDAYVYIIYADEEQNAVLVCPYDSQKVTIKANELFTFPGRKDSGVILKAILPKDRDESNELLHIILTKGVPLFTKADINKNTEGGYTFLSVGAMENISKKLAGTDRDKWTMTILPYSIVKRPTATDK
jgi:hypothetical protein